MILGILLITLAWGGNEVNNGGHAVVCKDQAPRLLDYVEHKVEGAEMGDYRPSVASLIAKLAKVDDSTAAQYGRRWAKWDEESELLPESKLQIVRDSFHVSVPKDCKLKQLAVRRQFPLGAEKRFSIDKDIWDKMPAVHQAGLVMHELIYEHFKFLGESDSRKARAYNAYIARMPEDASKADYVKFVKSLKVPLYPR